MIRSSCGFEFVVAMEIAFARRQVEAGADVIGVGDAAASLIGPKLYEQFVLPYEKRLVAAIKEMGARVRLHICGNTRKILQGMGSLGVDVVDLDFPCPMAEGRAAMPGQVLLGNIDPVRALRDGTPESITAMLEDCYQAAGPLPSWADRPTAAGNTVLCGARMHLLAVTRRQQILDSVLASTDHVELASDPRFQDAFVDCMRFPESSQRESDRRAEPACTPDLQAVAGSASEVPPAPDPIIRSMPEGA